MTMRVTMMKRFGALLAVLLSQHADAFVGPLAKVRVTTNDAMTGLNNKLMMAAAPSSSDVDVSRNHQEPMFITRRQALSNTVSTALMSILAFSQNPSAANAAASSPASIGTSPDSPIVVVGGGGKVGKLCTQILADKGLYVRCTTRSGRQVLDGESKFVSYAPCDVTSDESLKQALSGASGCIFAASSSGKKKGGDPIGTLSKALDDISNGEQSVATIAVLHLIDPSTCSDNLCILSSH